jgi:hypothetical protein
MNETWRIMPCSTLNSLSVDLRLRGIKIRATHQFSRQAFIRHSSSLFSFIMSNSTVQPIPAYFEESWAILSTIGLINVLFGFMIIAITSLSPLALVPIITSAAGAIANGLCY